MVISSSYVYGINIAKRFLHLYLFTFKIGAQTIIHLFWIYLVTKYYSILKYFPLDFS